MSTQAFIFPLQSSVKCIVEYLPELSSRSAFSAITRSEQLAAHELQRVLNELASLFATPNFTFLVMRFCRPILLDLACRIADGKCGDFTLERHEQTAVAFSRALPHMPQLLSVIIDYFRRSPSLFERLERPQNLNDPHEITKCLSICESVIRFLRYRPLEFISLWNWSVLIPLLSHPNPQLRRQVRRCVSLFVGISHTTTGLQVEQSAEEAEDIASSEASNALEEAVLFSDILLSAQSGVTVSVRHLSEGLVDVCGILLRKCRREIRTKNSEITGHFTCTPTAEANLHALALAVCQAKPILLQGLTGAGKTALIEHLAYVTNNLDIIKIHVSDQADAKSLLGSYVCTETPGEFRWQPGALTQAVTEGRWVLIEDIDLAPTDTLSVLRPVLETRKLFIPERGEEIYAASTFQIFATQRLVSSGASSGRFQASHVLSNFWTKLIVEPLSSAELTAVLNGQFPDLGSFSSRFIETFDTLRHSKSTSTDGAVVVMPGRHLSSRDLFKWCRRVVSICKPPPNAKILSLPVRESIFAEAVDCFCALVGKAKVRSELAQVIGTAWEISAERVEQYLSLTKPQLKADQSMLTVGRVSLHLVPRGPTMSVEQRSMAFAETRHSLVLLERIAASVHLNEPVLLIGETGTGKTTVIQYLAERLGQKLVVMNLSQQSDSSDLLGGFKPVELRLLCTPLKVKFEKLFSRSFSKKENLQFLQQLQEAFAKQQWRRMLSLMKQGIKVVEKKFLTITGAKDSDDRGAGKDSRPGPEESRKPKKQMAPELREQWRQLQAEVHKLDAQHDQLKNSFAFSFVEGSLVKAVHQGLWILLDEINLAPSETLESLSGLLEGGSLRLTERGDIDLLTRHPNFRLFACMNPPTDAGKKDLPPGLRSRFTEFYVDELNSRDDLQVLVAAYLKSVSAQPPVAEIVSFYLQARQAASAVLLDGANQKPHYSLRTLTRALDYTRLTARDYGFQRALFEGFSMSFLTQLNNASLARMETMIQKSFGGTGNLKQLLRLPKQPGPDWAVFESFWLQCGTEKPAEMPHYILTESIKRHLNNLARIVLSQRHPVLLQGPTSAGKTSMVEYLAKRTGHRFVRINNHEHTDLQEYLGTYQPNAEGKLVFEEGVLVQAVRNGHWIVLDELNLAPSEVLEALNRLLDDNRELFIPETQETVKPHPHFMLFATQNPPGLYGGRKVLSRAFRNRFIELHIDDIPEPEVEVILEKRCELPPSYCKKLVAILTELQRHRQSSKVFAGKHGFVTLRDLFRWAQRKLSSYQELADEGYMLLAERLRRDDEKQVIKAVLEKHLRVTIDPDTLYAQQMIPAELSGEGIVWTATMRRMFVLLGRCLDNKEPALLVGETGCGKTTVCQLYAILRKQRLHTLNCHQNTETADLLGGLRPIRGREQLVARYRALASDLLTSVLGPNGAALASRLPSLSVANAQRMLEKEFATVDAESLPPQVALLAQQCAALCGQCSAFFSWHDGPLVEAMRQGDLFLIDEISLAEDSVLERLNSVLEPSRILTLAEKGGAVVEELTAHNAFRVMATMNPGGDFGKKELSPAMRSRFTEIWVPAINDRIDLIQIIRQRLRLPEAAALAKSVLDFVEWFKALKDLRRAITLRDLLAWLDFVNASGGAGRHYEAFVHGACMVLLDGLAMSLPGQTPAAVASIRSQCIDRLLHALPAEARAQLSACLEAGDFRASDLSSDGQRFGMPPFFIQRGAASIPKLHYSMAAPTTRRNLMRLLRALQLSKPILLEGSPGVGKTSLVMALAAATGHQVVRINLSEQTDMMDLLGSDLPVEGGQGGEFAWRDGAFLQAMKDGHWVLLDELNLASQSVLEGLNACLDHRAEVYIPELNKTVHCPHTFRIFACQNPLAQGGGRKGLPKSFLNRFTQVHVQELAASDLSTIAISVYPQIDPATISKMIEFNAVLHQEVMVEGRYGRRGAPWEFNLRDVLRWCELLCHCGGRASTHLPIVYLHRMRATDDRTAVLAAYKRVFNEEAEMPAYRPMHVSHDWLQVGDVFLRRSREPLPSPQANEGALLPLSSSRATLEALMRCVEMNWMAILVGPTAAGKTSLVRLLARLAGRPLAEFSMNNNVDTMELLGGFEQLDLGRHRRRLLARVARLVSFLLSRSTSASHTDASLTTAARELQSTFSLIGSRDAFVRSNGAPPDNVDAQLLTQVLNHAQALLTRIPAAHADLVSGQVPTPDELFAGVRALQELEAAPAQGRFEWIDGMLIRALQEGHWLVIDNVNYCEPSVLDRLNPLLEPNGVLLVSERGVLDGSVQLIKPHPNFRLFLTMDPKNGELSRALRNRGVELFMPEIAEPRDLIAALSASTVAGAELPTLMHAFHQRASALRGPTADPLTLRDLLHWGSLVREELQRGVRLLPALRTAAAQVYLRGKASAGEQAQAFDATFDAVFAALQGGSAPDTAFIASPSLWPTHLTLGDLVFNALAATVRKACTVPATYLLRHKTAALQTSVDVPLPTSSPLYASLRTHVDLALALSPQQLRELHLSQPLTPSAGLRALSATEESILVAIQAVLEGASLTDAAIRTSWLQALGSAAGISPLLARSLTASFARFAAHPMLTVGTDLRRVASEKLAIDASILLTQPLNVVLNHTLVQRLREEAQKRGATDALEAWLDWCNRLPLALAHTFQVAAENEHFAAMQSLAPTKRGQLSLLQRSYLLHATTAAVGPAAPHTNRPDDEEAAQLAVPCMHALDDLVATALSVPTPLGAAMHGQLHTLLQQRNALWRALSVSTLDSSRFVCAWRLLAKTMRSLFVSALRPFFTQHVQNIAEKLHMFAERLGGRGSTRLWRHAGHAVVYRKNSTRALASRFTFVARSLELGIRVRDASHPFWLLDSSLARTMLQAVCTLHWIDEGNAEGARAEVLYSLERVASVFEAHLKRWQPSAPLPGDFDASDAALHPLRDLRSVRIEQGLLVQLVEGLLDCKDLSSLSAPLQRLIESVVSHAARSPLDAAPYQRLVWRLDKSSDAHLEGSSAQPSVVLQEGLRNWQRRLWNGTFNSNISSAQAESDDAHVLGSAHLTRDTESVLCFTLVCEWPRTPLRCLDAKRTQLSQLIHIVSAPAVPSAAQTDWLLVVSLLSWTLKALEKCFVADALPLLRSALASLRAHVRQPLSASDLAAALQRADSALAGERISDTALRHVAQALLRPCIACLSAVHNAGTSQAMRGRMWTLLGAAQATLLMPLFRVDPTAKYTVKSDLLSVALQDAQLRLRVREEIEEDTTGGRSNAAIADLSARVATLVAALAEARDLVCARPADVALASLAAETAQFASGAGSTERVLTLLSAIEENRSRASEEEEAWQGQAAHLVASLETKYGGYDDLVQPFVSALLHTRHGLRLSVASATSKARSAQRMAAQLAAFPVPRAYNRDPATSGSELLTGGVLNAVRHLPAATAAPITARLLRGVLLRVAIACAALPQLSADAYRSLDALFGLFVDSWTRDREEEKRQKAEKEALWKVRGKAHAGQTDVEAETAELAALFPVYDNEYKDLLPDGDHSTPASKSATQQQPEQTHVRPAVGSDEAALVVRLHSFIFNATPVVSPLGQEKRAPVPLSVIERVRVHEGAYATAAALLHNSGAEEGEPFGELHGGHIVAIAAANERLNPAGSAMQLQEHVAADAALGAVLLPQEELNPYTSAMLAEAQLALPVVAPLTARVRELLNEWPEHPLLLQIVEVGRRISSFSTEAPLMKLMTGAELLLRHAHDWETNAAARVSLSAEIVPLTRLIIRWRRIELDSWPRLLAARRHAFMHAAEQRWFELYPLLTGTVTDLNALSLALSEFIEKAAVGDFAPRLSLLHSFARQLQARAALDNGTGVAVAAVVQNIASHYAQFAAAIEAHETSSRIPIEKALADHIRLARWEDINYFALRDTIDKAHRTLLKLGKQYDEILRLPAVQILARNESTPAVEAKAASAISIGEFTLPPVVALAQSLPAPRGSSAEKLAALGQLASRMQELVKGGISGDHWERLASGITAIEDISVTIIERSTHLRNENRRRQEKKLALTEMLRGLAARGLRHHLQPAPIERALQEQPPQIDAGILPGSDFAALWRKADETFYRTLSRLPRCRAAARAPNKDLSSREVMLSLGFAEHLHSMIVAQRATLRRASEGAAQVARFVRTLDVLADETSKQWPPAHNTRVWLLRLRRLAAHATEAAADISVLFKALPSPPASLGAPLAELSAAATAAASDAADIIGRSGLPIHLYETSLTALMCPADRARVGVALRRLAAAAAPLSAQLNTVPDATRPALLALLSAIESDSKAFEAEKKLPAAAESAGGKNDALGVACVAVASEVQLAVQALLSVAKSSEPMPSEEKGKEETMADGNVALLHTHYARIATALAPSNVSSKLSALFTQATTLTDSEGVSRDACTLARAMLLRVRPLLGQYTSLSQQLLGAYVTFHKTVCKLQFVLLNTIMGLYRDGFCVQEEADEGKGGEKFQDDVAGTGMGEGVGKRDVSDQIEDESQLAGTRSDQKQDEEQRPPEAKEKERGVEMQEDFEGQMHDTKKPEGEDDEENEEEEAEPEKKLGETNPDEEQVVDEKLWNKDEDESEGEGDKQEEKLEKDAPVRSEQEKEMIAKPEGTEDNKEKKQTDDISEKGSDEEGDKEGEKDGDDEVNQDGDDRYEDAHRNAEPQKDEEMELPEDMKIDEPAGDDEKAAEKGEDEGEGEEDDKKEEDGEEKEDGDEGKEDEEKNEEEEGGEQKRVEEEMSDASAVPEDTAAAVQAPKAGEKGHGATQQAGADEEVEEGKEEDEVADKGSKRAAGAAAPQPGEPGEQEAEEGNVRGPQEKMQNEDAKEEKEGARLEPNPYRSPGDALNTWREKLRLLDAEHQPPPSDDKSTEGGERAFAEPEAQTDEQAMAPATEEQMKEAGAPLPAQREEGGAKQQQQPEPQRAPQPEDKHKALPMLSADSAPKEEKQPNRVAVEPEATAPSGGKEQHAISSSGVGDVGDDDKDEKDKPKPMEEDAESMRAALEVMRMEGASEAGAELWRRFESLTADLAQELCEQLRLILEPSLATKLKGDYRSGKRINMKKVIPYIASQFKKDKIWLRRTKPHKRAYQILIAIDDSKSMANNHSGQIACEALATIAAAMARLEVGEVGVVKFGADVELLHPLGQPFTDEAGARVLSRFSFAQNKDDFSLLLQRLVAALHHARSSASQGEHLQLSFIVSDGWLVLQEHRELNKWIREAAQQGILLVFIIIDSPNKKDSILETTSIDVGTGGAIRTTPYLDKFPFPYYIVLRQITTLPAVLADALRQWFELVQRMEEH